MDLTPSVVFNMQSGGKHRLDSFEQESCSGPTIKAGDYYVAPHESQTAAMPDWETWQSSASPLIGTGDPRAADQLIGGSPDPSTSFSLDHPIQLETDSFQGTALVQIKGLGNQGSSSGKWLSRTVLQGRFKQQLAAGDLWIGQEFFNPPNFPVGALKLVLTSAAKVFSSTCHISVDHLRSGGAGFMNPLLAMARVVNVCGPGQTPPSMLDVPEDARVLGHKLADKQGRPITSSARQKHFDKPQNMTGVVFDTQHTYTFVISQNVLDFASYKLCLGGWLNLELFPLLNGQPLQMMCKNLKTGKSVASLLMWHKHLNFREGYSRSRSSSSSSVSSSARLTSSEVSSGSCANSAASSAASLRLTSSRASSSSADDLSNINTSRSSSRQNSSFIADSYESSSCGSNEDECCSCSEYGSACSDEFELQEQLCLQTNPEPLAADYAVAADHAADLPAQTCGAAAAAVATSRPGEAAQLSAAELSHGAGPADGQQQQGKSKQKGNKLSIKLKCFWKQHFGSS